MVGSIKNLIHQEDHEDKILARSYLTKTMRKICKEKGMSIKETDDVIKALLEVHKERGEV